MSTDPWIWLGAIATLAIMSYLYKDNPVYKSAEYLFVGIASGYYLSTYYNNVIVPNLFTPVGNGLSEAMSGNLTSDLWRIGALVLGVMLFTRVFPGPNWPSRWPMGLLVGAYSGLAIIGFAQGDLLAQINDAMIPLVDGTAIKAVGEAQGWDVIIKLLWAVGNITLIVGLLASLYYFFFSKEHVGLSGRVATVGIWFLMISFGASYGFTVMARISLALDRLRYLFQDWLQLPIIS